MVVGWCHGRSRTRSVKASAPARRQMYGDSSKSSLQICTTKLIKIKLIERARGSILCSNESIQVKSVQASHLVSSARSYLVGEKIYKILM